MLRTMILKVRRSTIVKAIQTEPRLKAGFFVHNSRWNWDGVQVSRCAVCAVGTAIRSLANAMALTGPSLDEACAVAVSDGRYAPNTDETFTEEELTLTASRQGYMAGLSFFFEGISKLDPSNARKKTIAFVEKFFPRTVDIYVPDRFSPRVGVRIAK